MMENDENISPIQENENEQNGDVQTNDESDDSRNKIESDFLYGMREYCT